MLSVQTPKFQSFSGNSAQKNNVSFKGFAPKTVKPQVVNKVKKISIATVAATLLARVVKIFTPESDSIKSFANTQDVEAKYLEHFMSDMSKRSSFEDCSEQDIEAFDFCNRRLREIDENYRW